MRRSIEQRRIGRLVATIGIIAGSVVVTSLASAAPAPVLPPTPSMVSADALPTVQIDGVVWSQAVVGNTVYAGGRFNNARPAGAAAGTNLTPRSNLLAYDITTGNLITSFNPSLNGQVMSVAASPDGSRIYVVGDFTTANGQARRRVAAYSTATGALITSFAPVGVNSQARAVIATNDTVYVGGGFLGAGGTARNNLAAFRASDGALLNWDPSADYTVWALGISTDGSAVFAGGQFQNVGGQPAYGMAKINASTGALLPWNATNTVRSAGDSAGIGSLRVHGGNVYGTGWHFGPGGNIEGTFKASVSTGDVEWVTDCHGDVYSTFMQSGVVYSVGHAHYCGNMGGGFPQYSPSWRFQHTQAWSDTPGGEILNDMHNYPNWHGIEPGPSIVHWLPAMSIGSFTGQYQAGWTVTGNSDYVVVGGEFPRVNGVGQQGLVRFGRRSMLNLQQLQQGPSFLNNEIVPTLVPTSPTAVRVSWLAGFDPDDYGLTYEVFRGGVAAARYTTVSNSNWWTTPSLGFVDTGLSPGATYGYRIVVRDSNNHVVNGAARNITMPSSVPTNAYADRVRADGATLYWPLSETGPAGQIVTDRAGVADGRADSGVTWGHGGAIPGDTAARLTTNNEVSRVYRLGTSTAPDTFSAQVWINTGTTTGGRILGFGDLQTGNSGHRDRHIYMSNAGQLIFGVRAQNNSLRTIASPRSYNDNQWHQVTATMGADGMRLYVDGIRVGSRTDTIQGEEYLGYWRVGGDNIAGWPSAPSNVNFVNAFVDEVAVYPTALSQTQIVAQYQASGRGVVIPPAPADPYGAAVYADEPDLYWRFGESSGTTANDAGKLQNHGTYRNGVVLGQPGVVGGNSAARFDGGNDFVSANASTSNPTIYTEEAWFNTTTTAGGKIIGFGNSQTGSSASYDRHVYMQNDGRLVFGVWTGQMNTITTPAAYNNGQWHHVVATQSGAGMKLYLDGQLVGTNPQTAAENYSGYWKVGGDVTWGSSSAYFNGRIDEIAVYAYELSAARIVEHFARGGGTVVNQPPTAAFSFTTTGQTVNVNGSGSTDTDGSITTHSWSWGDNTPTTTGATTSHPYANPGTYTVTLTVTDNRGATDTETAQVNVTAPPVNQPPTAAFSFTTTGQTVNVNGSGSTDTDGSITTHSWSWGDNTPTTTGAITSHPYANPGTYTVTLTVTDNQGATDTETAQVNVTAPAQFALDTFGRLASNGFGVADVGGNWNVTIPSMTSVDGSAGIITLPVGNGPSAYLSGVSASNVDATVDITADKAGTGGGIYQSFVVRRIGSSDYRLKARITGSTVTLYLARTINGAETILATQTPPGLLYQPGQVLHLRLRVTGTATATLQASTWIGDQPEPTTWSITVSDNTAALQFPGSVGVGSYLSGSATNAPVTIRVDNLKVVPA